jgi:hypothetical protein
MGSGSRSRTGVLTELTHHRARWPCEQGGVDEDGCDCFDWSWSGHAG